MFLFIILVLIIIVVVVIIGVVITSNSGDKNNENFEEEEEEEDNKFKLCPPGVIGYVADPSNCSSFYFCPLELYHLCVDGKVFDIESETCMDKNLIDCGDRPYTPPPI